MTHASPFFRYLLTFLAVAAIATACKQPETIVITQEPEAAAPADTTLPTPDTNEAASFRQLNIGELQSIDSFDPLLAASTTDMRIIQLLYEGLVRFNDRGNIVPAVAQRWEVDGTGKQYTFHLRSDIYFHDSNIFSSGVGRKLVADDVKYTFRRMADNDVAPHAARLFMNIEGFDAYYQEQHAVYNPRNRTISGISGIRTPNDSTVVVTLNEADPNFLQKLATPLAVIYPREAVGGAAESFKAVGSGPFNFAQKTNDSTYVFSKFENYYAASDIQLNRIDITTATSGTALLNALKAGDIQYIPEIGADILQQVTGQNGQLTAAYAGQCTLDAAEEGITFTLNYYQKSTLPKAAATAVARLAQNHAGALFQSFERALINRHFYTGEAANASFSGTSAIEVAEVNAPYAQSFIQNLADVLAGQNLQLSVNEIRVPTRQTGLFVTQKLPLIPATDWTRQSALIRFTVRPFALKNQAIKNVGPVYYPWLLDLRDIDLPAVEQINNP